VTVGAPKVAVTVAVTVGAASALPCALDVCATAAGLVASLLAGWVGCGGCEGCAGCVDCTGCAGALAGLPPTLYLGIGGRAIEVLKPAGKLVFSVSEAGIGLLVADVKLQDSVVMMVGVGLIAVLER
jgi:hypothetical protein